MEAIIRKKEAKDIQFIFNITRTLEDKIKRTSKYLKTSKSQMARQVIGDFVDSIERERRKDILRAAYDTSYSVMEREAEDWDRASIEIL